MEKQKRVVVIQSLPCAGRSSMAVTLPVLSCAGLETSVLPTVVLSTHTAFPNVALQKMTDLILPAAEQWQAEGFAADAVYIGYLGSVEQTELIRKALPLIARENTRIYIDPVMGDGGKLYRNMDPHFPNVMGEFCGAGQVQLPNITEAALMTGLPYREGPHEDAYIRSLLEGLRGLGQEQTVLTGVMPDENHIGAAAMDCRTGEIVQVVTQKEPTSFCGTGDLFAAAFIGAQLNGHGLQDSLRIAEDFISGCIRRSAAENRDLRRGVNFEAGLGDFIRAVKNN